MKGTADRATKRCYITIAGSTGPAPVGGGCVALHRCWLASCSARDDITSAREHFLPSFWPSGPTPPLFPPTHPPRVRAVPSPLHPYNHTAYNAEDDECIQLNYTLSLHLILSSSLLNSLSLFLSLRRSLSLRLLLYYLSIAFTPFRRSTFPSTD